MTDLEMTRLCAEAMEFQIVADSHVGPVRVQSPILTMLDSDGHLYDPLHDDTQAMALVKKLHLQIRYWKLHTGEDYWYVESEFEESGLPDLNRSIVACVAKMRASK